MEIEMPRNDKNFNLDNISDREIFEGLNLGICECLKQMPNFSEITLEDIKLQDKSFRTQTMGADGFLYPSVCLYTRTMPKKDWRLAKNADIVVTPFSIQMLLLSDGVKVVSSKHLDDALIKFMTDKFPNSDYIQKRNKYIAQEELRKRIYDKSVFEEFEKDF